MAQRSLVVIAVATLTVIPAFVGAASCEIFNCTVGPTSPPPNVLAETFQFQNLNGFYSAKKEGNEIHTTLHIAGETLIGTVKTQPETNGDTPWINFGKSVECGNAKIILLMTVIGNKVKFDVSRSDVIGCPYFYAEVNL